MSGASAAEEAAVLDRFLTRLALTEEDKLEKVLSKLLPVAIQNLASPHEFTKKKVSWTPISANYESTRSAVQENRL